MLVDPNSCEIPTGLLQNSKIEKPKATVGTMDGISARLSRIVVQCPWLLTISQASGIPARTSRVETTSPITKDHNTAPSILFVISGLKAKLGSENS